MGGYGTGRQLGARAPIHSQCPCMSDTDAHIKEKPTLGCHLDFLFFMFQLLEEAVADEAREAKRVSALWDDACDHAVRKQGHMALAWQVVQGVSEKHLYGFHDRHGMRVRGRHATCFLVRGRESWMEIVDVIRGRAQCHTVVVNPLQRIEIGMCTLLQFPFDSLRPCDWSA